MKDYNEEYKTLINRYNGEDLLNEIFTDLDGYKSWRILVINDFEEVIEILDDLN